MSDLTLKTTGEPKGASTLGSVCERLEWTYQAQAAHAGYSVRMVERYRHVLVELGEVIIERDTRIDPSKVEPISRLLLEVKGKRIMNQAKLSELPDVLAKVLNADGAWQTGSCMQAAQLRDVARAIGFVVKNELGVELVLDPTVKWRGSVEDFVTDLWPLISWRKKMALLGALATRMDRMW